MKDEYKTTNYIIQSIHDKSAYFEVLTKYLNEIVTTSKTT